MSSSVMTRLPRAIGIDAKSIEAKDLAASLGVTSDIKVDLSLTSGDDPLPALDFGFTPKGIEGYFEDNPLPVSLTPEEGEFLTLLLNDQLLDADANAQRHLQEGARVYLEPPERDSNSYPAYEMTAKNGVGTPKPNTITHYSPTYGSVSVSENLSSLDSMREDLEGQFQALLEMVGYAVSLRDLETLIADADNLLDQIEALASMAPSKITFITRVGRDERESEITPASYTLGLRIAAQDLRAELERMRRMAIIGSAIEKLSPKERLDLALTHTGLPLAEIQAGNDPSRRIGRTPLPEESLGGDGRASAWNQFQSIMAGNDGQQ